MYKTLYSEAIPDFQIVAQWAGARKPGAQNKTVRAPGVLYVERGLYFLDRADRFFGLPLRNTWIPA
jgi:hypothetical protein